MQLRRPIRRRSLISIVSLIDVMMILLIFFMITSTYLDLDMIPAVQQDDAPQTLPAPPSANDQAAATVLIRLGSDGVPYVQGRPLDLATLAGVISGKLAGDPATRVIVLPSARASVQALVTVMDVATGAGASELRVVRLEPKPGGAP